MNACVEMAKNAVAAAVRGDVDAQYHWALELAADAILRGAKGPEADQLDARRYMDNQEAQPR